MENNINKLENILNDYISKSKNVQEIDFIKQVTNSLLELKQNDISLNKLEMIRKNIIFLETKYEEFAELSNYFDPIFIEIKKQIHINKVSKIREENRKKREGK